jgi:hypothetical protein
MRKVKCYIFVSISIILSMTSVINAEWFESQSPSLVNCPEPSGFVEIPDSHFIICNDKDPKVGLGANNIIFDKSTFRCRNYFYREHGFPESVIVSNPQSGWDIYFQDLAGIKRIHIDEEGKIGQEELLNNPAAGYYAKACSVPKRGEIWFIRNLITRFSIAEENFTEFKYPSGWDGYCSIISVFLTEDNDTLFVISYGNNIETYQLLMVDLVTGQSKLIPNPYPEDSKWFYHIYDIKEWINHDGFYLFNSTSKLYSYNTKDEQIELINDEESTGTWKILQSPDGKYIYKIVYRGMFEVSPELLVMDLDSKTTTTVDIKLDEGWGFDNDKIPVLDKKRNWIIILIRDNSSYRNTKAGYIDLHDYTYHTFSNISGNPDNYLYLQSQSKFFCINSDGLLQMVDFTTGEAKKLIKLGYQADHWSLLKDSGKPIMLGNIVGTEFCRILPFGRRQLYDAGIDPWYVYSFPNSSYALIIGKPGYNWVYKEYSFKDNTVQDLTLSNKLTKPVPDPNRNQIIDFGPDYVQFIKPHNNVRFLKPEPKLNYVFKNNIFDPENDAVWSLYQNVELQKTIIYKISTSSHEIEETIEIPDCNIVNVVNSAVDPVKLYLYILDRSLKLSSVNYNTILKIIDLKKGALLKTIPIQLDHPDRISIFYVTIPGLIPIPSENKLFIWDHYGSWVIDTETLEIKYGTVHDNIKSFNGWHDGSKHIDGIWDDTRRLVIIVDNTFQPGADEDISKKVHEIDLESGNVVRTIKLQNNWSQAFFPNDKTKILFLNFGESSVYTLHLTPAWENPALIKPFVNYVELGPGDTCKFSVKIRNSEKEQNVTEYIWLCTPTGDILFFNGSGFSTDVKGFFKHLDPNTDITEEFFNFKLPKGIPLFKGFYNLNAVFTNEFSQRGPIGACNFYLNN